MGFNSGFKGLNDVLLHPSFFVKHPTKPAYFSNISCEPVSTDPKASGQIFGFAS